MKLPKPIIIFALQVALLMSACDRSESTKSHEPRPSDTLYTEAAAIEVYAKQPELALAIIDSAVAVGNLDKDREEEVIPVAKHIAAIINDYRQHSDKYENNSYRLIGEQEEMEDYCNFYTAQSSAYLAHSYATIGATDSARHFLSLFEASDFGHTLDGHQMIAPTWCLLGDYARCSPPTTTWTSSWELTP